MDGVSGAKQSRADAEHALDRILTSGAPRPDPSSALAVVHNTDAESHLQQLMIPETMAHIIQHCEMEDILERLANVSRFMYNTVRTIREQNVHVYHAATGTMHPLLTFVDYWKFYFHLRSPIRGTKLHVAALLEWMVRETGQLSGPLRWHHAYHLAMRIQFAGTATVLFRLYVGLMPPIQCDMEEGRNPLERRHWDPLLCYRLGDGSSRRVEDVDHALLGTRVRMSTCCDRAAAADQRERIAMGFVYKQPLFYKPGHEHDTSIGVHIVPSEEMHGPSWSARIPLDGTPVERRDHVTFNGKMQFTRVVTARVVQQFLGRVLVIDVVAENIVIDVDESLKLRTQYLSPHGPLADAVDYLRLFIVRRGGVLYGVPGGHGYNTMERAISNFCYNPLLAAVYRQADGGMYPHFDAFQQRIFGHHVPIDAFTLDHLAIMQTTDAKNRRQHIGMEDGLLYVAAWAATTRNAAATAQQMWAPVPQHYPPYPAMIDALARLQTLQVLAGGFRRPSHPMGQWETTLLTNE